VYAEGKLETCFDADPQLAALTADLIEEVARLRKQLELR
jgi:chaperone modulatory protein CbpM